jgi:hypothetical protein
MQRRRTLIHTQADSHKSVTAYLLDQRKAGLGAIQGVLDAVETVGTWKGLSRHDINLRDHSSF